MPLKSGKAAVPDEFLPAIGADTGIYSSQHIARPFQKDPELWKKVALLKYQKNISWIAMTVTVEVLWNFLFTAIKVLDGVLLERIKEAVDPKLKEHQVKQISVKQIMFQPSRQPTNHCWTVCEMGLSPLHKHHRLWENIQQYRQKTLGVQEKSAWIFNSNIKAALCHVSEAGRMTKKTQHKVQTFINDSLRRILTSHCK